LEIRNGDGVTGAAHWRVLDPGEAECEVTAFDGLVDAGPLYLGEPGRAAPQSPRDALGDFDVEAAHARRIGGGGFYERRSALGVAGPQKRTMIEMLVRRDHAQHERREDTGRVVGSAMF